MVDDYFGTRVADPYRWLDVREVKSDQDLLDRIRWVKFSHAAWLPDDSGFFYTRRPEPGSAGRGRRRLDAGPPVPYRQRAARLVEWKRGGSNESAAGRGEARRRPEPCTRFEPRHRAAAARRPVRQPEEHQETMTRNLILRSAGAALLALSLAACGGERNSSKTAGAGGLSPESPPQEIHAKLEFPNFYVYDLDSTEVQTSSLLAGHESLVLYVSTGCEVCHETIEAWKSMLSDIPSGVKVFAIVNDDVDFARKWVKTIEFPFPLYVDTRGVIIDKYGVEMYPTVFGVGSDGRVIYVRRGVSNIFTPARAVMLLHPPAASADTVESEN